jgi:hypothetical protein
MIFMMRPIGAAAAVRSRRPGQALAIENVQRDFEAETEVDELGFTPLHDSLLIDMDGLKSRSQRHGTFTTTLATSVPCSRPPRAACVRRYAARRFETGAAEWNT